jgi:hypothetical protein
MRGRGRARELAVRDEVRRSGWVCHRLHEGPADLVAFKAGERPMLIQVKSTAGGPFEHFRPADRDDLMHEAIMAGADAVLAFWPPRGRLTWYASDQWPRPRVAA